jgi:plasmid stabilization system protein ParE
MPTKWAEFHQEATAEYDAAFDWYLARSPDAALKFDAEVDRALAQVIRAPQRWAVGPHFYAQVLTQAVPLLS